MAGDNTLLGNARVSYFQLVTTFHVCFRILRDFATYASAVCKAGITREYIYIFPASLPRGTPRIFNVIQVLIFRLFEPIIKLNILSLLSGNYS